jgi:hypothetical protein
METPWEERAWYMARRLAQQIQEFLDFLHGSIRHNKPSPQDIEVKKTVHNVRFANAEDFTDATISVTGSYRDDEYGWACLVRPATTSSSELQKYIPWRAMSKALECPWSNTDVEDFANAVWSGPEEQSVESFFDVELFYRYYFPAKPVTLPFNQSEVDRKTWWNTYIYTHLKELGICPDKNPRGQLRWFLNGWSLPGCGYDIGLYHGPYVSRENTSEHTLQSQFEGMTEVAQLYWLENDYEEEFNITNEDMDTVVGQGDAGLHREFVAPHPTLAWGVNVILRYPDLQVIEATGDVILQLIRQSNGTWIFTDANGDRTLYAPDYTVHMMEYLTSDSVHTLGQLYRAFQNDAAKLHRGEYLLMNVVLRDGRLLHKVPPDAYDKSLEEMYV